MKIADRLGKPIVLIQDALPKKANAAIQKAVDKSLTAALNVALKSIDSSSPLDFKTSIKGTRKNRFLHATATGVSGALGGFFGVPGLIFELPVTTSLMMRNIASIASDFGHCKTDPKTSLECLYVFTLGSKASVSDDNIDSAYYSSRFAVSQAMGRGADFIAKNSTKVIIDNLKSGTAPAVLSFINKVATYFKIVVTEKMLAEALPVVGSLGGAAVNIAFTDYFGEAAKYHFGLLSLEKKYGKKVIESLYLDPQVP